MGEGIQQVVDAITGPGNLPGAEVCLATLLVEVGEQHVQQQGNNARNDDDTRGDTIHEAQRRLPAEITCGRLEGRLIAPMFSQLGV